VRKSGKGRGWEVLTFFASDLLTFAASLFADYRLLPDSLPCDQLLGHYCPVVAGRCTGQVAFGRVRRQAAGQAPKHNSQANGDCPGVNEDRDDCDGSHGFYFPVGPGSAEATKATRQNGYGMGYLETFKIDQSGTITGVYTNGSNRVIGQLALGSFTNPGGLEKAGDNTYQLSNNSGTANIGASGTAGKGKVIAGTLEMSNVDLAEQFTDMIVTERGFQANSRTITTSDQMLQELLQLKR